MPPELKIKIETSQIKCYYFNFNASNFRRKKNHFVSINLKLFEHQCLDIIRHSFHIQFIFYLIGDLTIK